MRSWSHRQRCLQRSSIARRSRHHFPHTTRHRHRSCCQRARIVVDADGTLRWHRPSSRAQNPRQPDSCASSGRRPGGCDTSSDRIRPFARRAPDANALGRRDPDQETKVVAVVAAAAWVAEAAAKAAAGASAKMAATEAAGAMGAKLPRPVT